SQHDLYSKTRRCNTPPPPPRVLRSSKFCVATVNAPLLTAKCFCHAPIAVWPAFGTAVSMSMDRHTYQVHTRDGSARKASSVARCSGSKRSQSPVCASRNVGTEDSADIRSEENTSE